MQVHLYGKELQDGTTVTLDHAVQRYEVVVRSLCGISNQTLKDLIEKRYEVVSIKEIDRTDYVI